MAEKQTKPNRVKLTQQVIERLRPEDREYVCWDTGLGGFGVRVSPKGRKTFLIQFRVRGAKGENWKERQVALGTSAFMTVAQARERAQEYKRKAQAGTDPVAEQKALTEAQEAERKANEFTFAKLVECYEAGYVDREQKASGGAQKKRLLKRCLPTLGDRPVRDISEADILKLRNDLLRGKPNGGVEADNLVGAVRHMFKWAKHPARRLVETNPAAEISRVEKTKERDRYLSHEEIKRFWAACDQVGWPGGPIFKLLLLTGQREAEIGRMEWSELDFGKRTFNLPAARTKNNNAHTVHLSDLAMEVIEGLPQINGSKYVFTTNGIVPFTNYNHAKLRIHAAMGDNVQPWRPHDLRRTATTLMAELGVAHHVADKVLNHKAGKISGVAAIYNRFEYLEERKAALNALGRFIEQLIGRDTGNVVPLRQPA